jgi:L-fuculose-phosphate aldolase
VLTSREEACAAVLAVARRLPRDQLTVGTSGNVSARLTDGRIVITPSSLPYDEMTAEDLVTLAPHGEQLSGERSASSEKLLHLACYQAYPEVGSVLHTHPKYATMFACARQPVPAVIDEAVLFVGGEVQVAGYAMSGTAEVGANAVRALARAGSALLASHGLVTVAATPEKALHQAGIVEHCAQVAWGARQLGGHVPLPERTASDFADVYRFTRENPSL